MSTDRAGATDGHREDGDRTGGALTMRVVEYPDAADRCTIYPSHLDEDERMTHWLSADRGAFLALDQWR